jgi:hypothetical protein
MVLTAASGISAGATRYAKVTATGQADCSCWADACTLATAITGATSGDEVWAQSGTYGPIALKSGVQIIGGFTGTTETSASQSNPTANVTVIDGGGSRAVESEDDNSATVLRGFYIRNGNDTGTDGGGGMLIEDSSAIIVNCVFEDNLATMWGAAVAIRGTSSPQFINCTFRDNGWVDSEQTTNVKPLAGAAIYNYTGSPTFVNCLFHENVSGDGAVLANTDQGSATFINCTMADNTATVGGGGAVHDEYGDVVIRNSVLWGNTAADGGDQVYSKGSSVTTVTHSDVQGGWGGAGNIDSDPKFVNPSADDYKLLLNSPCKEKGHNASLPTDIGDLDWDGNTSEPLPLDLNLNPRTRACNVDMGAYEVQAGTCGGGGGGGPE